MVRKAIATAVLAALVVVSCPALVAQTMQWTGNFGPISLPNITTRTDQPTGSSTATLLMDGDVEISAENGATARLTAGGDFLTTEYRLEFDGDGGGATGANTVDYTAYDSFLSGAVLVTHVFGDDSVDVTLTVRASIPAGDVADAATYSATQTLTATWVGP